MQQQPSANLRRNPGHVNLDEVLHFILVESSRDEISQIAQAVVSVQNAFDDALRKNFRVGQEIEWTAIAAPYSDQVLRGEILKINRRTCTVAVPNHDAPDRRLFRVPFEILRNSE
jgi:hypothetical protein